MIDIKKCKEAFLDYVENYNINNPKIGLKRDHTFRVCEESINIARSLNLDEENTKLAFVIALLHDIGRFEQAKRYNTFSDKDSIDHADLGCDILFSEGLIRKFITDTKYDSIIEISVRNHNKLKIEDGLDEMTLMHAKIIRDIDKIDILNIVTNLSGIPLNDDNSDITKEVDECFFNEECVNHIYKKSKNDSVITMLSFIFDLNFDYSYKRFNERNYIKLFQSKLKNKSKFQKYIDYATTYIERKCNDVKCKI